MFALQRYRRGQANRSAQQLGGAVVTGPLPVPQQLYAPPPGNIGAPNPALPPAPAPDQRTGIVTSGPPIELRICGLPALVWQRAEWGQYTTQPMRLSLIADAGVGLPFLQLFSHAALLHSSSDVHGPIGIPALDQHFRAAGDCRCVGARCWRRRTCSRRCWASRWNRCRCSAAGSRSSRRTACTSTRARRRAIAQVAAALISAVPPQITSAAAAPPPTAIGGADLRNPDAVVQNVLAEVGALAASSRPR